MPQVPIFEIRNLEFFHVEHYIIIEIEILNRINPENNINIIDFTPINLEFFSLNQNLRNYGPK